MAKKKSPVGTSKQVDGPVRTSRQVDELTRETKETIELLESKDKRISELEAELNAYINHFGKLPTPAKPQPIFKPTCCDKDQKDCRMLKRIGKKSGECLKLRKDIDLSKPETDCGYFRQSL